MLARDFRSSTSVFASFIFRTFSFFFGSRNDVAHLRLLSLLEEGLLSDLVVLLLPCEITLLANLLHHLVVYAL